MALRYEQREQILYVEGTLDINSVKNFRGQLEYLMQYCDSLIINLDGIDYIDNRAIGVLQEVYSTSMTSKKPFSFLNRKRKKSEQS